VRTGFLPSIPSSIYGDWEALNATTPSAGDGHRTGHAPTAWRRERSGQVDIFLMSGGPPVRGHVESISRGITDRDNLAGPGLLANVNPTFEWVRLAQRTPVRIHIDQVPEGRLISSGMTCTVAVETPPREWAILAALRGWRAALQKGAKASSAVRLPTFVVAQIRQRRDSGLEARGNLANVGKKCMFRQISWIPFWALLLGFGAPADAQQPNRISRVSYLAAVSAAADAPRLKAFRQGLLDLGHIEGQNIMIEYRHEGGGFERLPSLAAELVGQSPDVFVAVTTNAAVAAKKATTTIPIVFMGVTDPITAGLVESLARPGGNITGITNMAAILTGKRLALLKETIPTLSHVAVLWDRQAPGSLPQWQESQRHGSSVCSFIRWR
jgi:hypothetical protein